MRVCPKCGYEDPPCWHPAAFHQEHSYARMDTLEMFEPEVWELMKDAPKSEVRQLGDFVYWRSPRSDTVRRSWVEDFKIVGKRGSPRERVDDRSPGQWAKKRVHSSEDENHQPKEKAKNDK